MSHKLGHVLITILIVFSFYGLKAMAQETSSDDALATPRLQVLIDPGHGGIDRGGITIGNTYEEPIVFDVAQKLYLELLNQNIKAELIRESDQGLGLEERVQIALQKRPQIFISLHANTHRNKRISGAEFYIEPSDALIGHQDFLSFLSVTSQSNNMADFALKAYNTRFFYPDMDQVEVPKDLKVILLDMLRMKTRGESLALAVSLKKNWKGSSQIREGNFYLLRSLPFTSVLVELGYISNEKDFHRLNDETQRFELAKQLAEGLSQYLSKPKGSTDETK
ncbi:MAG: N-acetylmuramoyl-L-alanine amidase [Bdellovibrionaceae bacterium]|nr:N-acetylmuramoyl-L-alanine amidase [Pseudobdellovibrionaceae bacterium]